MGLPGQVATPLRLVDELFQSGLEALGAAGVTVPVTLYEPCCGTAYHLAALAFLHGSYIATILASDVNASVLAIAQRNLDLLTLAGLDQRTAAIQQAYAAYGKSSHREALHAAGRLRFVLETRAPPAIETRVFESNVFNPAAGFGNTAPHTVSLVLTDLPYGQGSRWQTPWLETEVAISDTQLANHLLTVLEPILQPKAVVCLLAPKTVKVSLDRFKPLRRFSARKRLGIIMQAIN